MSSKKSKKKNILCSTCTVIKEDKYRNLFSDNKEDLTDFPGIIPGFNTKGTEQILLELGKKYSNRLIYFISSDTRNNNLLLKYPDSYKNSKNFGLAKLDMNGKVKLSINCPQPYKEKGISYASHIHILISNKAMNSWLDNFITVSVICKVDKSIVKKHLKNKDRLIINALPKEYFDKSHIPTSFNIYYKEAKKLSSRKIKDLVKEMIDSHKDLQKYIKKNKIPLLDTPILVYCYDKKCSAGHQLGNILIQNGFTNIIDYSSGIVDWMK